MMWNVLLAFIKKSFKQEGNRRPPRKGYQVKTLKSSLYNGLKYLYLLLQSLKPFGVCFITDTAVWRFSPFSVCRLSGKGESAAQPRHVSSCLPTDRASQQAAVVSRRSVPVVSFCRTVSLFLMTDCLGVAGIQLSHLHLAPLVSDSQRRPAQVSHLHKQARPPALLLQTQRGILFT